MCFSLVWLLESIASGRLTLSTPLQPEGCPLGWEWFSILFGLGAGRRRGIEYFLRLNLRQRYIDESSWRTRVVDRPKWKPDPDAGSERKPVEWSRFTWTRFQCLWPFVGLVEGPTPCRFSIYILLRLASIFY